MPLIFSPSQAGTGWDHLNNQPTPLKPSPELPEIESSIEYVKKIRKVAKALRTNFYDSRHYTEEGKCIKCPTCGASSSSLNDHVVASDLGYASEIDVVCILCETRVASWAYGNFMHDHVIFGDDNES